MTEKNKKGTITLKQFKDWAEEHSFTIEEAIGHNIIKFNNFGLMVYFDEDKLVVAHGAICRSIKDLNRIWNEYLSKFDESQLQLIAKLILQSKQKRVICLANY